MSRGGRLGVVSIVALGALALTCVACTIPFVRFAQSPIAIRVRAVGGALPSPPPGSLASHRPGREIPGLTTPLIGIGGSGRIAYEQPITVASESGGWSLEVPAGYTSIRDERLDMVSIGSVGSGLLLGFTDAPAHAGMPPEDIEGGIENPYERATGAPVARMERHAHFLPSTIYVEEGAQEVEIVVDLAPITVTRLAVAHDHPWGGWTNWDHTSGAEQGGPLVTTPAGVDLPIELRVRRTRGGWGPSGDAPVAPAAFETIALVVPHFAVREALGWRISGQPSVEISRDDVRALAEHAAPGWSATLATVEGRSAIVVHTAPAAGTVTLVAVSFAPGETRASGELQQLRIGAPAPLEDDGPEEEEADALTGELQRLLEE